ncbi:hypothetical protein DFH08DRAFT_805411 [Mycena albidolilacea]|uniref:Uncharacterized protein n=1 Tax=Mycena albidolilacea TaxID=1033008 RepID=A0AAD7A958_9AGAR|nr:hypothetical protein DFH08DRAFT_805411 [Mycena albidolilacea]
MKQISGATQDGIDQETARERFTGRKQRYVGAKNEFNFTFFNNYIHWPLERDTWRLNLTMEMFSRDRKFCEAIACIPLTTAQLVSILSTFSEDHPVISQYQLFCEEHNPDDHDFAHHTSWWIQSLSNEPTPEVGSFVNETIEKMDRMQPRNIGPMPWQDRVGAIGRVMLYLLAIQHELGETLLDILDGSILPLNQDWRNVFFFMYLATDPEELRHKDAFDVDRFKDNRDTFYSDHVIYDPTLHLPKFERRRPHATPICRGCGSRVPREEERQQAWRESATSET